MKAIISTLQMLLILFRASLATLIGCDKAEYNISRWNCEEHQYYFSKNNVERTMQCLSFGYTIPRKSADGTPTNFSTPRKILSITELNEETDHLSFDEMFDIRLHDERIKLSTPSKCSIYEEYPGHFQTLFIPQVHLYYAGIMPEEIRLITLYGTSEYKGDFTWIFLSGYRRATIPCHLNLKSYPFDRHKCEILLEFPRKTTSHEIFD